MQRTSDHNICGSCGACSIFCCGWSGGLETLDNIWDLFETTLRADSAYARTRLFEMAKWLEESQNLLDWIEKTPAEKQAWMEQVS